MSRKTLALLLIIVAIAVGIRLWNLNSNPPSLNWDEISHGYNAYSILKTGRDEWGVLPFANFRAYGDYPLTLNMYLTIPFIALFNLTEVAIRLPHVIYGVLTAIAVFFLVRGLTKNDKTALLASFLAAISPWYLFTSRAVFQSNLAVLLLSSAFACYFNREKNKWLLPLTFVFMGLTLFAYHSTRIITPILVLGIIIHQREDLFSELRKRNLQYLLSVLIIALFFIPLPFILLSGTARARSNYVFLINQGSVNEIIQKRNESAYSPLISKVLYNRPVYFSIKFLQNYVDYFTPKYLFLSGGTQYQFSVPGRGLLYFVNLPFFYLGVVLAIYKIKKGERIWVLILFWFIMSPIAAAITTEKYAVLRSTTMLPLPELFTAFGFIYVLEKWKKESVFLLIIYFFLLFMSLENYLNVYFNDYRQKYSWAWQYGYQQAIQYVDDNSFKYDSIIFTKKYGEPHEFVLFFNKIDPGEYKRDPNLTRYEKSNWYWVDHLGKYYFANDWDIAKDTKYISLESGSKVDCNQKRCILVSSPANFPVGWRQLETIYFLDGSPAFEIYDNSNQIK